MRFIRGDRRDPSDGIGKFWSWWADRRDHVTAAIRDETVPAMVTEISGRVHDIHKGMAWELGTGQGAEHSFTLTPEGDPEVRPLALAWLAAAPAVDAEWEYHASRQPGPLGTLEIDGAKVDLQDVRGIVGWDADRERADISLWHHAFHSLPDEVVQQVMFLFLDSLLGEDDTERWAGTITAIDRIAGRSPEEIRSEIRRQAATTTGERWALAEREDEQGVIAIVLANTAIKRIDHPRATHRLTASFGYGLEQMAGDAALQEGIDAAEEELGAALGDDAVNVGRVTERRRRTVYFVCIDAGQASEVGRGWADRHKPFGARIEVKSDPRWSFQEELLG